MTMTLFVSVVPVLLIGVSLLIVPAVSRPVLQFGVRIPEQRVGEPVIGEVRRSYYRRTAVLGVAFLAGAGLLADRGDLAVTTVVPAQLAAGLACYLLARRRLLTAKGSQHWYQGLTQTIAVDTGWRTDPERFPVLWAAPAVLITVATAAVGLIRYPRLPARIPAHLTASGTVDRWADTTPISAFGPVGQQLFVTVLVIVMLLITYRSRPDFDAADPAGSTRRYREYLRLIARSVLVLATLVDASLLLAGLQIWQLIRLTGGWAALPVALPLIGALAVLAMAARTGQGGYRLGRTATAAASGSATGAASGSATATTRTTTVSGSWGCCT
jgi:uncharacterized membrane protein